MAQYTENAQEVQEHRKGSGVWWFCEGNVLKVIISRQYAESKIRGGCTNSTRQN